ncbi:MAG: hypothetical protein O2892_10080 [Actinomycetota bacterium]|nr:hypothetical protein [Actinomycetota bacterium]
MSSENVTPTWSLNGLGEGAASPAPTPSAPENEDEPRRYCTEHNGPTAKGCGACAAQKDIFKAWKAAQDERDQQHREARRQARMNCKHCAGYLYLLGDDGTPVDPAVRCPVCTAEERTA